MGTAIGSMENINDIQSVIDFCSERCKVTADVDQIELYMGVIQEANDRLQALDMEFTEYMREKMAV